jgi:hypothetical protein
MLEKMRENNFQRITEKNMETLKYVHFKLHNILIKSVRKHCNETWDWATGVKILYWDLDIVRQV